MDNEIKIVTKLDPNDVISGANKIKSALDNVESKVQKVGDAMKDATKAIATPNMKDSLGDNLEDAYKKADKIRKDFNNKEYNSKTLPQVEKEIIKTIDELDKLNGKLDELKAKINSGMPVKGKVQQSFDAMNEKVMELKWNLQDAVLQKEQLEEKQKQQAVTNVFNQQREADRQAAIRKWEAEKEGAKQTEKAIKSIEIAEQKRRATEIQGIMKMDALRAKEEAQKKTPTVNPTVNDTALKTAVENTKKRFAEITSASKISASSVKDSFKGIGAQIINAFNTPFSQASKHALSFSNIFKKSMSGLSSLVSKLAGQLKKLIPLWGKNNMSMKVGFKTILKYAFGIRSLYVLSRRLRTAIKDGFGNLAQYSDEVNSSLNNMKGALGTFKNALATAFAPIVTYVIPALVSFINVISKALGYVAMFFGALTGKKVVTVAKTQKQYAGALGDTAKEAGKAKDAQGDLNDEYESGLDDLHKYDEEKGAGSGAGAGGGADDAGIDYSTMFEDVPIADKVKEFIDKLKKAWETGDFTEIGQIIGTKIRDMLNAIPWPEIQAVAAKLGKAFATLLNGIFSVPGLAEAVGRTIAEALNTGLLFAYNFVTNFDFKQFGDFIGTALMEAFNTFDFSMLGETIGLGLGGIINAIQAFLDKVEGFSIGEKFANIVNGIINGFKESGANIGTTLANFVNEIFETLRGFFESVEWYELGKTIMQQIKGFFENINWEEIGSAIRSALKALWEFIKGALSEINIVDVFVGIYNAIKDFFSGLLGSEVAGTIVTIVGLIGGFLLVLGNIGGVVAAAITFIAPLISAIGTVVGGIISGVGVIGSILGPIFGVISSVVTAIAGFVASIGALPVIIGAVVIAIVALVIANWDKVKDFTIKAWNAIKDGVTNAINAVKQVISTVLNAIKALFTTIFNAIKTFVSNVFNGIKTAISNALNNIKTTVTNILNTIKTTFSNVWNGIKTSVTTIVTGIKTSITNTLNTIKTTMSNIMNSVKTSWTNAWNGMKTAVSNVWSGVKGIINSIIGGVEKMVNGVVKGINGLLGGIGKIASLGSAVTSKLFGFSIPKIGNLSTVSLPRLATGAVIPANKEFLAVLGDQKHGNNIEAPENLIRKIVREESGNRGGNASYEFVAQINRKTIFDEVIKEAKMRQDATGKNPFAFA